MQIIVIGAGIIGSALAYKLSHAGAHVTVVEAGQNAGGGATGASFGWLNASFYADTAHYKLRKAGLSAWVDLGDEITLPELRWTGALWYEEQGAQMAQMETNLGALGYSVMRLSPEEIKQVEPALRAVPEAALSFAQEGIAEPAAAAATLLRAAQSEGAQVLYGVQVKSVAPGQVALDSTVLDADQVIVATGTSAARLLADAGYAMPMLVRPGLLLRTDPLPALLSHVLVTPEGEIRQDSAGRLIMPTAAAHQGDTSETVGVHPALLEDALARLAGVIDTGPTNIRWSEAALGWRPVPLDGLPVVGALDEGLYAVVMHSGMTLAAIIAELVTADVLGQGHRHLVLLNPYRPGRFKN